MSLAEAVSMLTPVARALSKAHRFPGPDGVLAILHCDLKPDNIFVSRGEGGETIKIFDFGIAKVRVAATREAGGATRAGETANMFTPAYAAPEQWAPDKFGQTGPWTDVFALALTLTELCTQRPAIDGPPAAMLAQCLDPHRRPTPKRLGLDLPDELDQLFARALAVDPKDRTQSIEAFWGALEKELEIESSNPRKSHGNLAEDARRSRPSIGTTNTPSSASGPAPAILAAVDASKPNSPPGADFFGDLDLAPQPAPAASPAAPAQLPLAGPTAGSNPLAGLELSGPASSGVTAPTGAPTAHVPPGLDAMDSAGGDAFDLAAQPERAAPTAASPAQFIDALPPEAPPPTPSNSGFMSPERKEQLKAAAQAAAQKAGQAASAAAGVAAGAARDVATRAIAVDKQPIRLDDPSTWVRPMRGPLIAFGAAVLITIVAVVGNSATGSNFPVRYISLPLLLAAVGFIVFRWIKLQKE
jgi:serine/threonine-protein kinase